MLLNMMVKQPEAYHRSEKRTAHAAKMVVEHLMVDGVLVNVVRD